MDKDKNLQLIIFGASGNLTSLKLFPAIYKLASKNLLPEHVKIFGFSRQEWDNNSFISHMQEKLKKNNKIKLNEEIWKFISSKTEYVKGTFEDTQGFETLKEKLKSTDNSWHVCSEKIFYLAVPPEQYNNVIDKILESGLDKICSDENVKLVIEKPFGHDYTSAKELNNHLLKVFREEQIYRIDHVLGKDALVDILSFRELNPIISNLLDNEPIDHIQISYLEQIGIGSRGGFYDKAGVVRDMVQNHLLQILAVATGNIDYSHPSDARAAIINCLAPVSQEELIIGQYDGYKQVDQVNPNSQTPTFIALKSVMRSELHENIKNDIPVYFRTGKKLQLPFTEIDFVFNTKQDNLKPNILSFRIQPQSGVFIVLKKRKINGEEGNENIVLEFCYKHTGEHKLNDAYENLLYQVLKGDRTYFVSIAEVLAGWNFVDPINTMIDGSKIQLETYPQGSWGPNGSSLIVKKNNTEWFTEQYQLVCRL